MAREGELSLNYRDNDQYRYYSASVQLFPWLETTLRYTDVRTRQYSSVEAFLVIKRIKIKPSISNCVYGKRVTGCHRWRLVRGISAVRGCSMRNILSPAKHGGHSILRSALGWGYLGTSGNVKNPLCSASDKYCYRDNSYKQAGSIDGSQMFHGPASLFGGVEYQTPRSRCV